MVEGLDDIWLGNTGDDPEAPFVISDSYLEPRGYFDEMESDGMTMTFVSVHRPLQSWFEALSAAGLVVETLRETRRPAGQWSRVPLFLHLRARRATP